MKGGGRSVRPDPAPPTVDETVEAADPGEGQEPVERPSRPRKERGSQRTQSFEGLGNIPFGGALPPEAVAAQEGITLIVSGLLTMSVGVSRIRFAYNRWKNR